MQPARGHCRLVPLSVISCLICFLGFVLLFLPDTVFVVAQLRHRIALVLFRKMVSSANTGTGYEPARLRAKGIFSLWVCLGFTCWDADIHGGPTVNIFLGIRRYHTSTYLRKLVRNIWAMGFVHFSSSDQENPTLDSMSPLR